MSLWFRFYDDAINDAKVLRLSDAMFRAWVTLLCLACKNDGILPKTSDIALVLRMRVAKVAEWLTALTAAGLLDNENGTFRPHNWNARQYKSDVSTERVKQFRERQRNVSETANETPPETEQKQSRAEQTSERDRFDEFWKAYPRRDGANPRGPAEKKFNALVKSGIDPDLMISAVRKLAADEGGKGRVGTQFIPMAQTWLNQQRWSDHAAVAFLADDELPRAMTIEQALEQWARFGRWSIHAPGTAPGEPGCVVTAEQFAVAGLDLVGRKLQPTEPA